MPLRLCCLVFFVFLVKGGRSRHDGQFFFLVAMKTNKESTRLFSCLLRWRKKFDGLESPCDIVLLRTHVLDVWPARGCHCCCAARKARAGGGADQHHGGGEISPRNRRCCCCRRRRSCLSPTKQAPAGVTNETWHGAGREGARRRQR